MASLEELASLERQRKAWVNRTESSFPSPVELVCQLFDDTGIDDLLAEGPVFSRTTDAHLKMLSALTEELDLSVDPDALLSSEEWLELSRRAARSLEMVKADLAE